MRQRSEGTSDGLLCAKIWMEKEGMKRWKWLSRASGFLALQGDHELLLRPTQSNLSSGFIHLRQLRISVSIRFQMLFKTVFNCSMMDR